MKNKKICDFCNDYFGNVPPCEFKDCPVIPMYKTSLKFLGIKKNSMPKDVLIEGDDDND